MRRLRTSAGSACKGGRRRVPVGWTSQDHFGSYDMPLTECSRSHDNGKRGDRSAAEIIDGGSPSGRIGHLGEGESLRSRRQTSLKRKGRAGRAGKEGGLRCDDELAPAAPASVVPLHNRPIWLASNTCTKDLQLRL